MLYNYERVSKTNPCPVCGKDHWCRFAKFYDKRTSRLFPVAICNRITSDVECEDDGGGWIHFLGHGEIIKEPVKIKLDENKLKKADLEVLDAVYKKLIYYMPNIDLKHLSGFSQEDISYLGYKYYDRRRIKYAVRDILKSYSLEGIPGAYTAKSKYEDSYYWTFGGMGDSIMIPIRDLNRDNIYDQGPIQGILLRIINPVDHNKYNILSSTKKRNGTNAGAPIHVSIPREVKMRGVIGITEGVKKADFWSKEEGLITLGMQGLCWKKVPILLQEMRQMMKIEKIIIALDMDKILPNKESVRVAEEKLSSMLRACGYKVYIAFWDPKYGKAIDDLLYNKKMFRLKSA